MKTIGERVRAERAGRKWSRDKLAKMVGVSTSAISDLELGYSKTSLSLHRISEALDVNTYWLETGKGDRTAAERSQSARFDDETMAQAVELLYLMADARPEDKRFRRFNWAMILLAAKGITNAEGDPRKAMAMILADLATET